MPLLDIAVVAVAALGSQGYRAVVEGLYAALSFRFPLLPLSSPLRLSLSPALLSGICIQQFPRPSFPPSPLSTTNVRTHNMRMHVHAHVHMHTAPLSISLSPSLSMHAWRFGNV
jgi:hypothetical protein